MGWERNGRDRCAWGFCFQERTQAEVLDLSMQLEPGMGWRTRRMAAAMVGAWAASSPSNCIRLAEAGAARVLSSGPTTSMGIGTVDGEREVHWEVVRSLEGESLTSFLSLCLLLFLLPSSPQHPPSLPYQQNTDSPFLALP